MESYQDNVPFVFSTPKLPAISTGGLVTGPDGFFQTSFSSQWAGSLRRDIDHAINVSGRVRIQDIALLHKELVKLIILVLQPNSSKQTWQDLKFALDSMQPYVSLLTPGSGRFGLAFQTQHYVERLYALYEADERALADLGILESLEKIFPNELAAARAKFSQTDFDKFFQSSHGNRKPCRKSPHNDITLDTIVPMGRSLTMDLPDGRNPYALLRRGDEPELYFRPRPLTLIDFKKSIPVVAGEMNAKESSWNQHQSSVVAALAVELSPPSSPSEKLSKKCVPLPTDEWNVEADGKKSLPASPRKAKEEFHSITGEKAVELFLSEKHLHKVKFLYFNYAKSWLHRPYDLISVQRDQVDPEHYIFSSFGVLHCYPNGSTSDIMSLADWNREAALWNVVSKLGFFKNFLICKAFSHWRSKVRRQRLIKARSYLRLNLLPAIPEFGSALLHISRLVGELHDLQMLPNESSNTVHFTVVAFEVEVLKKKKDSEDMLTMFFQYCKKVVDVTRQQCFDQLKHYEYQMKHSKSIFSKESLYLQKMKQQVRNTNLENARQAIRQLASFITLVDQIISVHLVDVLRSSIRRYVYGVLSSMNQDSDESIMEIDEDVPPSVSTSKGHPSTQSTKGDSITRHSVKDDIRRSVFVTRLVFNPKTFELEMFPSHAKFKEMVGSCINDAILNVCDKAYSMNISGKQMGKQGDSAQASVDSAPSSTSDRSLVDSLSSEINEEEAYAEVDPQDEYGIADNKGFEEPVLEAKKMPTKEDDEMGVATPNLIVSPEPGTRFGLAVQSEGIVGQYYPLDQSKLKNKLLNDLEIRDACSQQKNIVDNALREVEWFCLGHNAWIVSIRAFTSTWSHAALKEWRQKPAREIENLLNQIKAWTERVKNVDRSLLCSNRLLLVDCRAPQTELVPALTSIFKQLIVLVADNAKNLSLEVTTDAKEAIKVLENKDLDMKSFAAYARKVTQCQVMKDEMSDKVTYIRSLYEVMRMTHRQLTHEEEKMDERVKAAWEAFLFQLKDALNFVSNQRPIILKQLDDKFREQYSLIQTLCKQASSGSMIDPTRNPPEVIAELKGIIAKFHNCRRQLLDLSNCRESVIGETYDLSELDGMATMMEDRLELWKFVGLSSQTERDWKNTLFRRFNVNLAEKKITDWRKAIDKLQKHLPKDDAVLLCWQQNVKEFARELPYLKQLSDEAIKFRHWKQIFTGMGESFDPSWTFTVNDLILYKLSDHSKIINQVYHSATAEFSLEQMLQHIKSKWEAKQFNLAKHIYVTKTTVRLTENQSAAKLQNSRLSRSRGMKRVFNPLTKIVNQEKDSDTYVLVGADEIQGELADSHMALQGMLQSRHAAEVRGEAEIWSDTLQQIGEIVSLWTSCQDKWMYLNQIFFGQPNVSRYFSHQLTKFEVVDRRYREFIRTMIQDPKVLSVLSRRHGQKGWRELQGENLRKHLINAISLEEELLSSISYLLEEFRSQFPRMYFLCDEDCSRLLALSRHPRSMLPYIRKCFRGIRSLVYQLPVLSSESLPAGMGSGMNSLDLELHSHKLQVTHMQGHNREYIAFRTPLATHSDATSWMRLFEEKMQQSIGLALQDLIHLRLKGEEPSPMDVLEEISRILYECNADHDENIDEAEEFQFGHWLLRYPSQVILLSESILLSHMVENLLRGGRKKEEYAEVKRSLQHKIKELSNVVLENAKNVSSSPVRSRLQITLSSMISLLIYYRDILQQLQLNDVTSVHSFEWQRIVKHTIDPTWHQQSFSESKDDSFRECKCYIEHMGEYVATYGLEYKSPRIEEKNSILLNSPIAMTPLAERTMFSLCLAMRIGKCGALVGPEGTGKSCVITHLASVFGCPLININCNEELTINMLNRSLSGAVESGAWLCLDQAHCLQSNILSFLAQQIRHIQQSYRMLLKSVKSQYSAWVEDTSSRATSLKRSSSIPSLHSFKSSNGRGKNDYPEVSLYDLSKLYGSKEEGFHFFSNQKPQNLGSIIFNGRLLQAKPNYGIFMTLNVNSGDMPDVPHNLKLVYRNIALIKIDTKKIVEVWLQCAGFSSYGVLADKLCFAREVVNGLSENIDSTEQNTSKVTVANLSSVIVLASACNANTSIQYHSRTNSTAGSSSSRRSSISSTASTSTTGGRQTPKHSETALIRHGEELAIVNSLVVVLSAKLSSPIAVAKLKDVLRTVFPLASRPMSATDQDNILSDAISQQFQIDGLNSDEFLVEKTVQLNTALNLRHPVIILGPAGCGKTTIYKTLARTLNKLYAEAKYKRSEILVDDEDNLSEGSRMESSEVLQPSGLLTSQGSRESVTGVNCFSLFSSEKLEKIDISVVYPNNLRTEDLFGGFDPTTNVWQEGMLCKILKSTNSGRGDDSKVIGSKQQKVMKSNQHPADDRIADKVRKWIVMDCELHPPWIETLSCLFDINKSIRLSNMDDVDLDKSMNMIFEATDIAFASPAILSRSAIVHVNGFKQWQFILDTWLDSAYGEFAVTKQTISVWRELLGDFIPETHTFLQHIGRDVLQCGMTFIEKHENSACCGVQQATSFIQILSSLLHVHLQRKSMNEQDLTDSMNNKEKSDHMRSAAMSVATDADIQSTMTAASSTRSRLDDTIPESNHQLAVNLLGFAFVWAYGGKLLERDMKEFDIFFRQLLEKSQYDIQFPPYETVFEYFVEEDTGHFTSWEDKIDLRARVPRTGSYYSNIHQNERYSYLSHILLRTQCPILLVGEAGCGKSSLIANVLSEDHEMTKISMSRGLTSYNLQKIIEVRASPLLKQHNLGLMAHPNALIDTRSEEKQKILFFLDDMSCASALPSFDTSSSMIQPTHELIRQIMSFGGVYERERKLIKTLEADINFIAAATILATPGSGYGNSAHSISPRLTRLFTVIHFLQPSKDTILSIYHNAVQSWLEEFPAYSLTRHYDLSQAIIAGAVELYSVVKTHLRPSPRNPHYVFSLHDIAHIMQGLFLLTPRVRGRPMPKRRRGMGGREDAGGGNILQRPGGGRAGGRLRTMRGWGELSHGGIPPMMRTVIRVWLHECSRTFYDRLSNNSDRQWFSGSLQALLKKHFCTAKDERGISPGIERVRIIKTPIPSGGGTPLPPMARASTGTSENDGTLFSESNDGQQENFIPDEESGSLSNADQIEDNIGDESTANFQQNESGSRSSTTMDRLTPAAISELHSEKGWDENVYGDSQESSLATRSRMPVEIALSPLPMMAIVERRSESVVDSIFTSSNDGADGTPIPMRNKSSASNTLEDMSVKSSERRTDTKFSGESVSDGDDDGTQYDSRATSNMDMKTEDDENRSLTTGMTAEIETDTSEYSADDSDENIESTTTAETRSTLSKASQKGKSKKKINKLSSADAPDPSAAVEDKRTQSRPQPVRPGGAKLGVTFIPGLIDDPDRLINTAGPLAQLNQILSHTEDPTEIMFSRFILSAVEGGTEGYSESTSGQLATALKIAQDAYNSDFNSHLDLVYFKEAVRHASKLSRVLCMKQEGHALLLSSTHYSGRHSITRLVSYLCKAKVFESQQEFSDHEKMDGRAKMEKRAYLKSLIISASMCAGIKNESTVLLVDECFTSDQDCLSDICSVIKDGQSPSLYSHDVLATIAAEIMPGSAPVLNPESLNRSGSAIDKLDHCLEFYFQRVVSNLHIVLLLPFYSLQGPHDLSELNKNMRSSYFHDKEELHNFYHIMRKCPDMLTRFSCIDIYEPWDHFAWTAVGEKYIEDFCGVSNEFSSVGKVKIPWPSEFPLDHQIANLCHVMSFIHLDALERTKQSVPMFTDKIVTPLKFQMMVDLFVTIAVKVGRDERKTLKRYEQVLKKVRDAETSVDRYGRDKESLLPRLAAARDTERAWKRHVEQERREYIEARQRCDLEEEIIEELGKEVEYLKEDSKLAFDKVNPMYKTALDAMDSLTVHSINEIKSYKKPPQSAVIVVSALCDMFSVKPANWENGRALIMRDNFFEELEFYNKDNIPEDVYVKLSNHVKNPSFQPSYVQNGSIAAFSLCQWMHAIHRYGKMSRYLAPKIARLKKAETKMERAQATLGAKRVRCNQIKDELDSKIEQHKKASHAVRQLEKELKNLEAKIAKAQTLMGNLSEYVTQWRRERDITLSRLDCAVGDSLLTAACATYHGVLGEKQRNQSLTLWKQACEMGFVDQELGTFRLPKNSERSESTSAVPTSPAPKKDASSPSSTSKSGTDTLTWDDIDEGSSQTSSKESRNGVFVKISNDFNVFKLLATESMTRAWHCAGLPRDEQMRSNVLYLLSSALYQETCYPLIFDPDEQLQSWIKTITENYLEMKHKNGKSAAVDFVDSPEPSTAEQTRSGEMSIFDDDETTSLDDGTHDYTSSYFDDGESTVISVSSTSQTMRSGGTSRKPSQTLSSRKSKGVRFADNKQAATSPATALEKEEKEPDVGEAMPELPANDIKERQSHSRSSSGLQTTKLVICGADDVAVSEILGNAVANGSILLITHLERASRSLLHTISIITQKMRYHENDSSSSLGKSTSASPSVSGEDSRDSLHPDFRLFLSAGMNVGSIGNHVLPMNCMACMSFALRDQALEEKLMQIVVRQEKPEFESHHRLLEADIFHLEEEMENLKENLLIKVSNIEGAILADVTLLDTIRSCKRETLATLASLQETKIMETNLLAKKVELAQVGRQGRIVFDVLLETSALKPNIYHWTAKKFIDIFVSSLKSRIRGKSMNNDAVALQGSVLLKSRVVELNQVVLEAVLRCVKRTMYHNDVLIFTTFVTLAQLICEDKMNEDEVNSLLLGMTDFTISKIKPTVGKGFAGNRPRWMSDEIWFSAHKLEQKHESTFGGLTNSLSRNQKRWKEYLSCEPVLLSNVPCTDLLHLTVGQKALLWKVLRPDIGGTIISELGACMLGGITSGVNVWNIQELLENVPQQNPIIFLIPEKGSNYQPTVDISNEAERKGISFIERSAPFQDNISDVMKECMLNGHWLFLHNCELAQPWPVDVLDLLYSVTSSNSEVDEVSSWRSHIENKDVMTSEEVTARSVSTTTDENLDSEAASKFANYVKMEKVIPRRTAVHESFRLWLITTDNEFNVRSLFPGILLQHSEIVNLEFAPNHRELTRQKYVQLNNDDLPSPPAAAFDHQRSEVSAHLRDLKLRLSLFHAVFQQRLLYYPSKFLGHTDEDILDVYKCCHQFAEYPTRQIMVKNICSELLSNSIFDQRITKVMSYFLEECFIPPETDRDHRPRNKNLAEDLCSLLRSVKNLDHGFDSLSPKIDLVKLNLPIGADLPLTTANSIALINDMRVAATSSLISAGDNKVYSSADSLLTAREVLLKRRLESLHGQIYATEFINSDCITTPKQSPITDFYRTEIINFNKALSLLRQDIPLMIDTVKGHSELNPTILSMLENVHRDEIPDSWVKVHPQIFRHHKGIKLSNFILRLQEAAVLIQKYAQMIGGPSEDNDSDDRNKPLSKNRRCSSATQTQIAYNLSAFFQPHMFLKSVLAEVARLKYHDAQRYHFKVEVTSKLHCHDERRNSSAMESILLDGLWLQSAYYDERFQTIHQTTTAKLQKLPPVLITAVKIPAPDRRTKAEKSHDGPWYQCPIFVGAFEADSVVVSNDILLSIPIKSDVDPELLRIKHACAISCMYSQS